MIMAPLRRAVCILFALLSCSTISVQAWVPAVSSLTRVPQLSPTQLSMAVPLIEDWKVLKNGRLNGVVTGHPDEEIDDGDTITTSPLKDPDRAASRTVVVTISGSKYRLGESAGQMKKANGKAAPVEKAKTKEQMEREAKKKYKLDGNSIGPYALSGSPMRSTSGKSQIWTAYRTDSDGLPTGEPLTIKTSPNREKLEGEYLNYRKVASGISKGRFVKMIEFLPKAGETKQLANQAALVVEKGDVNLKSYFKRKPGGLEGKALRDAASAAADCVQAVHSSKLVWTDLKPENFVVINDKSDNGGGIEIKGIDLESVCPVKDNPIDYSPESCPPEFARALLAGDGPYFVLEYSYDIWSYGIMLYELATGTSPYGNKTGSQISKMINSPDYEVDVSAVSDPKLQDLISKCLQTDPKKRPSITQILLHPYFLTTGIGPFSF